MARANRVLWILVGLLVLAVGVAGVLAGLGRLPGVPAGTHLLPHAAAARWAGWGVRAWLVLVAVGLVLVLLGVLLVRAQLRVRAAPPMPDLLIVDRPASVTGAPGARPAGRTRVRSAAMVHSLERDLARHPKVHRVGVQLGGDAGDLRVTARLAANAGTDVRRLQRHLGECLERFRTTTGLRPRTVEVTVHLTDRDATRVH